MMSRINQGCVATALTYSIGGGTEREVELDIRYVVHPGRPQSRMEPGEADTVEIVHVRHKGEFAPAFIFEAVEADQGTLEACWRDWHTRIEAARDEAADARREEHRWRAA